MAHPVINLNLAIRAEDLLKLSHLIELHGSDELKFYIPDIEETIGEFNKING